MALNSTSGGFIVIATVAIAMIISLLPMPESMQLFKPQWVMMTVLYWSMAIPQRFAVGFAWVVGLVMDVLMGGALGIFAFCYALASYVVIKLHLQLRQYPMWQQALIIMVLIMLTQGLNALLSPASISLYSLLQVLVNLIIWPFIYGVLRKVRHLFNIS